MKNRIVVNIVLIIFILISLVDLYTVYHRYFDIEKVVKPLIVVSLTGLYIVSAKKINAWYIIALFFSFLGDFFLLDSKLLLLGLSCFLVAHLIYIKLSINFSIKISLVNILLPLFFFVTFLIFIIWLIEASINSFIVLVIIYGLVICSFATLAFFNYSQRNDRGNLLLFLGAFLFVVANAFIGLNRFYDAQTVSKTITMGCYIVAQFLICRAMIKKSSIQTSLKKETILLGVFFITAVIGLLGVSERNIQLTNIVTPALFFSLIVIYVGTAKRMQPLFLLYLVFILIAEILMLFKDKFVNYALVISVLSQFIIMYFIFKYKHIRLKNVLLYFVITFLSYFYLYEQVSNIESSFMIIVYGIVNAFLTSLALDNYISKMYMANYLLWLGISFGVLNNAIICIDVYDSSLNVYAFITNVITHYLICRSFVIRQDKGFYKQRLNYVRK